MTTTDVKDKPGQVEPGQRAETFVDTLTAQYNEPSWLTQVRRKAWGAYDSMSMPDRVAHAWRYTDPERFVLATDQILPATVTAPAEETKKLWSADERSGVAVWQGGKVSHLELDPRLKEAGVLLLDLHTAARDYQRLVEAHLGRAVKETYGKFEALNEALWQAGFFLHVPRHVEIPHPIHLIVSGSDGTEFLAPRILIGLDEGAHATIVNEFVSPKSAEFAANTVVEAEVGQAAGLRLVTVQRWGEKVTSHFTQRGVLARDAQLLMIWAGLGAGTNKANLGTRLAGRGAHVKLLGMSFGQHNQQADQRTVHEHVATDTFSDLDFKVVLKDKARSAYTGLIRIEPGATNCEAYQENRNLMLSEGTRADTIPELEILNDEVRCSHGATIGPLSEEELFYLMARGIPRSEAIRMVVNGFVEPTLKEVPDDLRERLRSYVMERVKEI